MATDENLQEAFAGESQANRHYLAFAKKAEAEGYPRIARLFRATAEAETVHAHAHLRVMGGVNSTKENLQGAMEGESYEFKKMYPKFVEEAQAEQNKPALASFQNAMTVEQIHHGLFSEAAEALAAGKDMPDKPISVCSVCGNTIIGDVPDKCPVCGVSKDKFVSIE
ncbi:MAG: rubrerythrin family protein [Planctomycetota bacterium]